MDRSLEAFSESYDNNPLSSLDDEFYDACKVEDLEKISVDFIRANKVKFIDS